MILPFVKQFEYCFVEIRDCLKVLICDRHHGLLSFLSISTFSEANCDVEIVHVATDLLEGHIASGF